MGKDTSPYVIGGYWLDKRRDGRSPDIWQIARYDAKARSDVYRSTKCRELDDAIGVIHAFVEKERAKGHQPVEAAAVLPQLILYYDEHGSQTKNPDTIAGSLRHFIGFVMQDEVGARVTVAQINKNLINRYIAWRMGPHGYSVPWRGKEYVHKSDGVKGESVQRNIEDLRAALNHAANNQRIPYVPKIPSVPKEKRSRARDTVMTIKEMGAALAFLSMDKSTWRWVVLMMTTASRPDACLAFDPAKQWRKDQCLLDMHPPAWDRTKKVNPVIPQIPELEPILNDWLADPHTPAASRRNAWRHMRTALGLSDMVVPKTIRHTLATLLRSRHIPQEQISALLGHAYENRTTAVYAKYDPAYLREASAMLSTIWGEIRASADQWFADHMRTKDGNGPTVVIDRKGVKR